MRLITKLKNKVRSPRVYCRGYQAINFGTFHIIKLFKCCYTLDTALQSHLTLITHAGSRSLFRSSHPSLLFYHPLGTNMAPCIIDIMAQHHQYHQSSLGTVSPIPSSMSSLNQLLLLLHCTHSTCISGYKSSLSPHC